MHLMNTIASSFILIFLFFFNDTATTEIYTLSLHDALPIQPPGEFLSATPRRASVLVQDPRRCGQSRSEEHTSELQSRRDLVCRLLLEKKKKYTSTTSNQQQEFRPTDKAG